MKHTPTLFSLLLGFLPLTGNADVELPNIFGNHMVLQRGAPLQIWGTADAGEKIALKFGPRTFTSTTDEDGDWEIGLPSLKSDGGKSHKMTIKGKNTIVLENILIGDVWIGSGQSNMEWNMNGSERRDEFVKDANHPGIRLFHIPKKQFDAPQTDVEAKWKPCTSSNIPNFSAVLYHFGKTIQADQKVPIGLINSSWGGSPIEPWTVTDKGSGKMYNGMIAPIVKFPVTGTIWYQGETNCLQKNGLSYTGKMKDLIEGWRRVFNNGNMPFYFVQIAPWNGSYAPGQLPALWEAQCATLKLPHTGMAVTTDIVHNIGDIHPRNKHDVGNRLARWALARHYQKKGVICSGPLYKAMKVESSRIRLAFAHSDGLKSRDGKDLNEFKIAGSDGQFVDAKAEIEGKFVLVSAESIKNPTQVRFGWHKVANPNLVNRAGLPASPFQTEKWTGGTGE
ncbi:MAG: sialate O-acetylesterase [Roseibacillus sp.]|nr:sialate O-acetylesterase [Verrucomicrobiota bacterium]NRB26989.1 sialate O-acetylesterase [Roseibacillus sp.]